MTVTRRTDEVGNRYGMLRVLAFHSKSANGICKWTCVCDCGRESVAHGTSLRSGKTKSCGCKMGGKLPTHGMTSSRTYNSWKSMRARCGNPNSPDWKWYGAIGVSVCARWESFEAFLEDMGERPPGRSLDRIDPFGNYEPKNCRWATPAEQIANRRMNFN